MASKGLCLALLLALWRTAGGTACTARSAESCVDDDVSFLQTGIDKTVITQEDNVATEGRTSLQQGLFAHRFATHLASSSPMLNCTDSHGAFGTFPCLDVNGRSCGLCGQPGPMFPEYADGFIVRDDCGSQTDVDEPDRPLVSYNNPPSANFLPPKTGAPNSWTNAWCEKNSQKSCADADANRDYFYYAAGFVVPPGFDYDFYYCKYNGYLEDAFVKNMRNYTALYEQSAAVCAARDAEFNVSSITARQMAEVYRPDLGPPGPETARWIGAWTCAMGGPGGDISYCGYTYKKLSEDSFCQYPSGPGFKGTLYEGTPAAKRWECPRSS